MVNTTHWVGILVLLASVISTLAIGKKIGFAHMFGKRGDEPVYGNIPFPLPDTREDEYMVPVSDTDVYSEKDRFLDGANGGNSRVMSLVDIIRILRTENGMLLEYLKDFLGRLRNRRSGTVKRCKRSTSSELALGR